MQKFTLRHSSQPLKGVDHCREVSLRQSRQRLNLRTSVYEPDRDPLIIGSISPLPVRLGRVDEDADVTGRFLNNGPNEKKCVVWVVVVTTSVRVVVLVSANTTGGTKSLSLYGGGGADCSEGRASLAREFLLLRPRTIPSCYFNQEIASNVGAQ